MPVTFTAVIPSGSTDGKGVLITTTSTPGDTIHTADATALDEVYLWVANLHSSAVTLTIEWGGTTDPGDLLVKTLSIPANSPVMPVAPGIRLTNSKVVRAFASVANKLIITCNVNRIA